jgi:hypothetical protein
LAAAAAALKVVAPAATGDAPLLYGPLLAAVAPASDDDALAFELIHEGYLLHYRQGRLLRPLDRETSLLAGDFFYARGLRLVACCGDVEAVDLLTRLMASCACLRAAEAPFSHDDDLWVVTVAAVGALRGGGVADPVLALFERFHELAATEVSAPPAAVETATLAATEASVLPTAGPSTLPTAARASVRELKLANVRPLADFLVGDTIGPDRWLRLGYAGAA